MFRKEAWTIFLVSSIVFSILVSAQEDSFFLRGDVNQDTRLDISDAIYQLNWMFRGGPMPKCMDAVDANDDGRLDISDVIYSLNYLFKSGLKPPEPFFNFGGDKTSDSLGCDEGIESLYSWSELGEELSLFDLEDGHEQVFYGAFDKEILIQKNLFGSYKSMKFEIKDDGFGFVVQKTSADYEEGFEFDEGKFYFILDYEKFRDGRPYEANLELVTADGRILRDVITFVARIRPSGSLDEGGDSSGSICSAAEGEICCSETDSGETVYYCRNAEDSCVEEFVFPNGKPVLDETGNMDYTKCNIEGVSYEDNDRQFDELRTVVDPPDGGTTEGGEGEEGTEEDTPEGDIGSSEVTGCCSIDCGGEDTCVTTTAGLCKKGADWKNKNIKYRGQELRVPIEVSVDSPIDVCNEFEKRKRDGLAYPYTGYMEFLEKSTCDEEEYIPKCAYACHPKSFNIYPCGSPNVVIEGTVETVSSLNNELKSKYTVIGITSDGQDIDMSRSKFSLEGRETFFNLFSIPACYLAVGIVEAQNLKAVETCIEGQEVQSTVEFADSFGYVYKCVNDAQEGAMSGIFSNIPKENVLGNDKVHCYDDPDEALYCVYHDDDKPNKGHSSSYAHDNFHDTKVIEITEKLKRGITLDLGTTLVLIEEIKTIKQLKNYKDLGQNKYLVYWRDSPTIQGKIEEVEVGDRSFKLSSSAKIVREDRFHNYLLGSDCTEHGQKGSDKGLHRCLQIKFEYILGKKDQLVTIQSVECKLQD